MDDDTGRVVAWVSPDGAIRKGNSPLCEPNDLDCPNVQAAIERAKEKQSDIKQRLVDKVMEDLKVSIAQGDYTTLDEILNFVPTVNLIQSLPEEEWKNHSPIIKK